MAVINLYAQNIPVYNFNVTKMQRTKNRKCLQVEAGKQVIHSYKKC